MNITIVHETYNEQHHPFSIHFEKNKWLGMIAFHIQCEDFAVLVMLLCGTGRDSECVS